MALLSSHLPQTPASLALKLLNLRLLLDNPRLPPSSSLITPQLSSSSMFRLSALLDSYALLWGWMVVIGGFGPKLSPFDFWTVAILVFLRQLRNPSALGISNPLPSVDITEPLEKSNGQTPPMSKMELHWQVTQLSFVLPSLVWSALRWWAGEFREVNNLGASLVIFFSILVCGCCAAMGSAWLECRLQTRKQGDPKIRPGGCRSVVVDRATSEDTETGAMAEHGGTIRHTEGLTGADKSSVNNAYCC